MVRTSHRDSVLLPHDQEPSRRIQHPAAKITSTHITMKENTLLKCQILHEPSRRPNAEVTSLPHVHWSRSFMPVINQQAGLLLMVPRTPIAGTSRSPTTPSHGSAHTVTTRHCSPQHLMHTDNQLHQHPQRSCTYHHLHQGVNAVSRGYLSSGPPPYAGHCQAPRQSQVSF